MKNRLFASFVVVLLLCVGLTSAQDNTPTPITIDNAADLQPLSIVGSALPGKLAYSPDGRYILAATTEHTAVYRADDLSAAPRILPFTDFIFNPAGELIADGQIWNLNTGQSIGIAAATRILPPSKESPNTRIEITKPGGETLTIDTGVTERVYQAAVNSDYTLSAIATGDTIRLYRLPDKEIYAILPQEQSGVVALFFSGQAAAPILVVATRQAYSDGSHINIYDGQTGILKSDYSGLSPTDLKFNLDRSVFAYGLEDNGLVIGVGSTMTFVRTLNTQLSQSSVSLNQRIVSVIYNGSTNSLVQVFIVRENNLPQAAIDIPMPTYITGAMTARDQWLVFANNQGFNILNMTDLSAEPRLIEVTDTNYRNLRINPDGTRIGYTSLESQNYILRDLATDTILVDISGEVFINPDWTTLAYWRDGEIIVRDLDSLTDTALEVIPGYIGNVVDVDFGSGQAAYNGESFQLVDFTNLSAPSAAALPLTDPVPYGGQFVADGGRIVVFSATSPHVGVPDEAIIMSEYELGESLEAGLIYANTYISEPFRLSPQGNYIVHYMDDSYIPYGAPSIVMFPFVDIPPYTDVNWTLEIPFAHNVTGYVFTADETALYGVDRTFARFDISDPNDPTSTWNQTTLIYYDGQDNGFDSPETITLSPNEVWVALGVLSYDNTRETPYTYTLEVFALESLAVDSLRSNLTPALLIPDVRIAAFSPDSQMLVTELGLYSLKDGLVNPAIDGTISAFSPDSTLIATYQDGYVTLWNIPHAEVIAQPLAQYALDGVTELGFSPDGSRLYIVRGGDVQVWGLTTP